ncbi:MAG TPA: S8 family serine peptidase [Caldimonas sp.]|nr:S8 family serine peptidase [Caldimonas sp.]
MKLLVVAVALCVSLAARAATGVDNGDDAARADQQVLVLLKLPPPHFRPDGSYSAGYADAQGSATRRGIALALARRSGLALATGWPMPLLGLDCYVMDVPAPLRAGDVAAQLARDARVEWAQPMNVFRSLGHDDPLFAMQPAAREWHLAEMHATATGKGVRVAVIDSGVELDHPDLAGQVAESANFTGGRADAAERHGTAVAGVVAARADNHVGIVGVAPGARLLALRACRQAGEETLCTTLGLALAMHAAIERDAQVINLSLAGPADRLIEQLIRIALERGVSVVAAADRALANGGFPAALRGVVAVVDEQGGVTPGGMVAAPGSDVPTTVPVARWTVVSGASFAAAHVSGLLALMREARGSVRRVVAPTGGDLVVGTDGRIDACASLVGAGAACVCDCAAAGPMAASIAPR